MPLTTRRTTEFPVEHKHSQRVVTRFPRAEAAIFSGHPEDTEQADLRSPRTPWAVPLPRPGALIAGHTSPLLDDFAIDRSAP